MASTAQKRNWYYRYRCAPENMVRVAFPGVGRSWSLLVADVTVPAWQWFAQLMTKHDYAFRESAGGTYNCRKIGGSNQWSLHAYGIALDLNPSANSYGQTGHDFPQAFLDDVAATGLFRWGQVFQDPMHWEIDVPPSQLPTEVPEDTMAMTQEAQAWYQEAFERLQTLDPPTSESLLRTTAKHIRDHPPGGGGLTEQQVKNLINDGEVVWAE